MAGRTTKALTSLVRVLVKEATAGSGMALLLASAAVLVLLSPQLALFTFGSDWAAREEAVLGSLMSLTAVTTTVSAVILVRVLVEEGTLVLLTVTGGSGRLLTAGLCASLLAVAAWQCPVLACAAVGALAETRPLFLAACLVAAVGFAAAKGALGDEPAGAVRPAGAATGALVAMVWFMTAVLLVLMVRGLGGVALLAALLCTAAWGSLVGTSLGLVLNVPQALVAGIAVWFVWTAAAPAAKWLLGFGLSPLAPWNALLGREACGAGLPRVLLVACASLAAWSVTVFSMPLLLSASTGRAR